MKTGFIIIVLIPLLVSSSLSGNDGKSLTDITSAPKPKWKFRTGGAVVASPVADGQLVYFGSNDSVLYAVNVKAGNTVWTYKTQGSIRSTVAIEKNYLFLVGGEGVVYSFDKQTGKVSWTFKTGGEKLYQYYSYADYYFSSPVIADGVVYFGSGDGFVYALQSETGALLWRFKTGNVVHSSPLIYGGKVFVGSFDGYVYALQRETGELAWKFKSVGHRFFPAGEMQGTPVAANGLVYIGSRDYNLYALDTTKGFCHWNKQFTKGWALALSVRDTMLYVGTSDDDLLIAMDGRTGKEHWRTDVKFNIFGSPAFSKSMIYTGTLLGRVHGIDLQTGSMRWTINTDGCANNFSKYFSSESAIVKDNFYAIVQTPEGYIEALHGLGAVFSTPALTDEGLIVSSTDGTVYCLKGR